MSNESQHCQIVFFCFFSVFFFFFLFLFILFWFVCLYEWEVTDQFSFFLLLWGVSLKFYRAEVWPDQPEGFHIVPKRSSHLSSVLERSGPILCYSNWYLQSLLRSPWFHYQAFKYCYQVYQLIIRMGVLCVDLIHPLFWSLFTMFHLIVLMMSWCISAIILLWLSLARCWLSFSCDTWSACFINCISCILKLHSPLDR